MVGIFSAGTKEPISDAPRARMGLMGDARGHREPQYSKVGTEIHWCCQAPGDKGYE